MDIFTSILLTVYIKVICLPIMHLKCQGFDSGLHVYPFKILSMVKEDFKSTKKKLHDTHKYTHKITDVNLTVYVTSYVTQYFTARSYAISILAQYM